MPNIKFLTIHIEKLNDLVYLLTVMINLTELNLSVSDFNEYEEVKELTVPKSLIKLHFEVGKLFELNRYLPNLQIMSKFLLFFRIQLKSLALIVASYDKEFVDPQRFEILTDRFLHLTSFQYLIHTPHCPPSAKGFEKVERLPDGTFTISTNSRPANFSDGLRWNGHSINPQLLGLQELYNATELSLYSSTSPDPDFNLITNWTFDLLNLRKITYSTIYTPTLKQIKILSKLLTLAPNIHLFNVSTPNSHHIISLLEGITINPLKTIVRLEYYCSTQLYSSFLIELAKFLPQLKYLYLCPTWSYNNDDRFLTPNKATDGAKKYFQDLTDFKMRIATQNKHEERYLQIFLSLLNNQQEKDLHYVDYHKEDKELHLWL
jgi:hypothetical protein